MNNLVTTNKPNQETKEQILESWVRTMASMLGKLINADKPEYINDREAVLRHLRKTFKTLSIDMAISGLFRGEAIVPYTDTPINVSNNKLLEKGLIANKTANAVFEVIKPALRKDFRHHVCKKIGDANVIVGIVPEIIDSYTKINKLHDALMLYSEAMSFISVNIISRDIAKVSIVSSLLSILTECKNITNNWIESLRPQYVQPGYI